MAERAEGRTNPPGRLQPAFSPLLVAASLAALTALVGASYLVGIGSQEPEVFYAAAARSMSQSWHNFLFASFDPAGTISVDKLPGALWLQALSVRTFGVHLWAINLPQAVEGILTVVVLFRAVQRLFGPGAGLVAAAVYATAPVTVALNRGNISDSLLILLLVCAADAAGRAIQRGRLCWLIGSGLCVGLAFQAKMLEAWLLLPLLVGIWLIAAPSPWPRRVAGAAGLLAVSTVVSLSWMTVVSLVPAHQRPYVDGSTDDSVWAQVFNYNGFGRSGGSGSSAGQPPDAPGRAVVEAVTLDDTSPVDRTLAGPGGRAVGWLIPAAVAGFALGLVETWRRPRRDAQRAATLLWGGWLLIDGVAFSVLGSLNPYYLAALTPPVAALVAVGARAVCARPGTITVRAGVLAATLGTVGYGAWLLGPAPGLLRIGSAIGGVAVVATATGVAWRSRRPWEWTGPLLVGLALAAMSVAPAAAAVSLVVRHEGPFDTPFEPSPQAAVSQQGVANELATGRQAAAALTQLQGSASYPAAAYTSLVAAPLIYTSGKEILPVGGFTGQWPSPSVAQLAADVRAGRVHLFLTTDRRDLRVHWVQTNCTRLPGPGPLYTYACGLP